MEVRRRQVADRQTNCPSECQIKDELVTETEGRRDAQKCGKLENDGLISRCLSLVPFSPQFWSKSPDVLVFLLVENQCCRK